MKARSGTAPAATALAGLLLVALTIYWPGLSGAFLFDDWSNLKLLGHQGAIDRLDKFVTYLLTGFAGPTGRPVAMASFLLDANTWPAPPQPFKRTNLLIHLLNGALLTALQWQIARQLGAQRQQAAWIAVLGAGIWLLHPLWVSTTLYVVQRMTLLAATFVLAGLVTYLHGRRLIFSGRLARGYAWTTIAVVAFAPLAVLSKESGALLPLLILVLERYALSRIVSPSPPAPRGWRAWKAVFLAVPSLLVLGYLASALPALIRGDAAIREFTPGQRLLTEGRILLEYLSLLLLPRPFSGGIFSDAVTVSTGLFAPVSTFFSLAMIAALIALAEKSRRAAPALAVAIMFFLAGHVLESTWLQLELRFEHRNYLPAAILFLPLAWWLVHTPKLTAHARAAIALALLTLVAGETLVRADLWGKPFSQALAWARQNPNSPRAQNHLASFWMATGNYAEAHRLMQTAVEKHPDDLLALIGLVSAKCALGDLSSTSLHSLFRVMRTTHVGYVVGRYQLDRTLSFLRRGGCKAVDPATFEKLIDAGLENPKAETVPPWRQMLYQQRAQLRLDQNHPDESYADLMHAVDAVTTHEGILASAALLANSGHLELALRFLDDAPAPDEKGYAPESGIARLRRLWQEQTNYYAFEREELRKAFLQDLRHASKRTALQGSR